MSESQSDSDEDASVARSDQSREYPPEFKMDPKPPAAKFIRLGEELRKSGPDEESASSSASVARSDRSREYPPDLKMDPKPPGDRLSEDLKMIESDSDEDASVARSDQSREYPPEFKMDPKPPAAKSIRRGEELRKSGPDEESASSSASVARSDQSREYPPEFKMDPKPPGDRGQRSPGRQQHQDTSKVFESKVVALVNQALSLDKVHSRKRKSPLEEDVDDETREAALKVALSVLRTMNEHEHADTLEKSHYGRVVMYEWKLKQHLKQKHTFLMEQFNQQPVPLKQIYTTLYLIEGSRGEVNNEHEVRQIEAAFNRRTSSETLIRSEDIFKPLTKQTGPIRTVLTKGIAGIGKTVLTLKFMLDWSEEKAHQDIHIMSSLPFKELNFLRGKRLSLMELLYYFFPGLKESKIKDLNQYRVLLILDGLDESRLCLDFKGVRCHDATEPQPVEVLLTNLIARRLLPNAILWITTRPAAAHSIPPRYIDRETEIRGFNNHQKEQYFLKKIENETLAKRVIANIRSTRSLYIMCHVPVFCWISSIVLREICAKAGGGKLPKTLTQMYINFVAHQTTKMTLRNREAHQLGPQVNNTMIMSLGKLAYQQLEKGNLIFYEEDLTECDIDVNQACVYSGLCTEVFKEESWLGHKAYSFVHLSVQEFLAALYVHVMHKVERMNLMIENPEQTKRPEPLSSLHRAAVDRALKSDNGHLDLFLRFLLGLSMESSQGQLRALRIQLETCDPQSHKENVSYIKEKINQDLPPEKYVNLFHCLNELNDHSLVDDIQSYLDSDRESVMDECSAARWAALVFVLLTSPEKPEEIHLKKYSRTQEGLKKLLPAIKASRSAVLNDCNLTEDSCQMLSITLSSSRNELKHLNLSDNVLKDSGIKLLCQGLLSPECRLKTLRLNRCSLTERCCEDLATVLRCKSSHLQELDLSDNEVGDSGVKHLCTGLGNVSCKLEVLRLSFCSITEGSCGYLASAVKSNPSHLSELDLSYNHLEESGVRIISAALEEAQCEFTQLRVHHNAQHWFKPGLKQHGRELTLDPNTAHRLLVLSEDNRRVSWEGEQAYPDHPDRFDYWAQVLIQQGLKGRCYWEVEWDGNWAGIGVTYKSIGRKGPSNDCVMGYNQVSWSLHCSVHGYHAYHNFKSIVLQVPLAGSRRLAVYLDWEGGILSFYRVSGGSLTHLHTFTTTFTEPLYPVFRVWGEGCSLRLV